MKIDRLTIIQRLKMIKSCYKKGYSTTVTHRALRGDYGLRNRSTTQAIGKIVKKFEMPVHHRFAHSAENIATVSESVDSSSFSGIKTILRHIMAYFAFRFTSTFT